MNFSRINKLFLSCTRNSLKLYLSIILHSSQVSPSNALNLNYDEKHSVSWNMCRLLTCCSLREWKNLGTSWSTQSKGTTSLANMLSAKDSSKTWNQRMKGSPISSRISTKATMPKLVSLCGFFPFLLMGKRSQINLLIFIGLWLTFLLWDNKKHCLP